MIYSICRFKDDFFLMCSKSVYEQQSIHTAREISFKCFKVLGRKLLFFDHRKYWNVSRTIPTH